MIKGFKELYQHPILIDLSESIIRKKDRYEAHDKIKKIVENLCLDLEFIHESLRGFLSEPKNLYNADYLTIPLFNSGDIIIQINLFCPIRDRAVDITQDNIHHHGWRLLTTGVITGDGYETINFTRNSHQIRSNGIVNLEIDEIYRHSKGDVRFIDSFTPHVVFHNEALSSTLAVWSADQIIPSQNIKRLFRHFPKIRQWGANILHHLNLNGVLGLNQLKGLYYHPENGRIVETQNYKDVLKEFGHIELQAQKIVIIGGGNIGFSLAELIEKDNNGISTELIEMNKERAEFVASNLNNVTVTNGDGLDNQILDEVNIAEAGYCLAVTEDDEVNVLASLLAKRAGTNQCMALINNSSYTSLLSNIGIDITIDPKLITISKILEKVRGGGIMSDYSIGDGFGEVIEAMIKKQSPLCNKNLKELNLPKSIRIASILRDNKIIIPNSNTVFKENDDVVFFAENQYINKLEKLLSNY